MPLRLEVFLQFSFSNIDIITVVSFVQETLEKFLTIRLILLLYGNQYRNLCFVHKTTYLWSMRSPGGEELSLSACPGVGNRPPNENKIANPRGYARGGMVTGRIEPCITNTMLTRAPLNINSLTNVIGTKGIGLFMQDKNVDSLRRKRFLCW